jgi:hypothetical protein
MASLAKRAGTNMTLVFAPVASTAILTGSNTGILPSRTHSPPFQGYTCYNIGAIINHMLGVK